MANLKPKWLNTERLPSSARNREMNKTEGKEKPMNSENDWRLAKQRSWRDSNSTLEIFAKVLGMLIALMLVLAFGNWQIEKNRDLISSVIYGCELGPNLKATREPPVPQPTPSCEGCGDWLLWYDNRLKEVHGTNNLLNADKLEIQRICK